MLRRESGSHVDPTPHLFKTLGRPAEKPLSGLINLLKKRHREDIEAVCTAGLAATYRLVKRALERCTAARAARYPARAPETRTIEIP